MSKTYTVDIEGVEKVWVTRRFIGVEADSEQEAINIAEEDGCPDEYIMHDTIDFTQKKATARLWP